jgi:hypothetical protein
MCSDSSERRSRTPERGSLIDHAAEGEAILVRGDVAIARAASAGLAA